MTRRDYVVIAAALRSVRPTEADPGMLEWQWDQDRWAVADALQADNPRFDRQRFYEACCA